MNTTIRYIQALWRTHLKCWVLYVLYVLMFPIIGLFSLFTGLMLDATTGSNTLASYGILVTFVVISSLFFVFPNAAMAWKWASLQGLRRKWFLFAVNHSISLAILSAFMFFLMGLDYSYDGW